MKIIFAGTPEFALPCLRELISCGLSIAAVYTQPDRPAGRGHKLIASPVKQVAVENKIPVFQPERLRDPEEIQKIRNFKADLMIVIAYGLILPKEILESMRYGCMNVHASLLPRWRGASPIQSAILAGDQETGITMMQMDSGLDTGDILFQKTCSIKKNDTAQTLHDRLAELAPKVMLETLIALENNSLHPQKQNNDLATHAPKITKEQALIDWREPAIVIERKIRAFNSWPIAYTNLNHEHLRIWSAEVLSQSHHSKPGTIIAVDKSGIDVATGEGVLRLLQCQFPGAKCLPVADILNSKSDLLKIGLHFE